MRMLPYNQENILIALEQFIDKYNRLPHDSEMPIPEYGIPIRATCIKYLGKDWRYTVLAEYVKQHTSWSEEAAAEALLAVFISNGTIRPDELGPQHGLPSEMECIYFFGKRWRSYFYALANQQKEKKRRSWNKEAVYQAIDRFYCKHGRYPTTAEYTKENNLPSPMSLYRYLTKEERDSLSDALHKYHTAYWTYDEICNHLAVFTQNHGRLPKFLDFSSENNLPSWLTLKDYLGSDWRGSFDKWVNSHYNKTKEKQWTEHSLNKAIVSFYLKNIRLPTDAELILIDSLPSPKNCIELLGPDWREYDFLREHLGGEKVRRHRQTREMWTKEMAEVAIGKYIKKHGRFPKNQDLLEDETMPSPFICKKFLGKEWRTVLALQFAVDL